MYCIKHSSLYKLNSITTQFSFVQSYCNFKTRLLSSTYELIVNLSDFYSCLEYCQIQIETSITGPIPKDTELSTVRLHPSL